MDSSIKTLVSRKYGFWFYQLTGWGIFMFYDFFMHYLILEDPDIPYFIFSMCLKVQGFFITIGLRYVYRKYYDHWKNAFQWFLVALIIGAISGVLRYFLENLQALIGFFGQDSFLNHTLDLPPEKMFVRMVFLSWPVFIWTILYFMIKSRYEYQEEKENAIQSQLLAKDAQLRALRYQINPHFLFNTLISVQGLMYHNTKLADKMLTELSEFLRYTLRYNQLVFVPLKDEIEIIEKYLSIQKIRFGEKLKYTFSIANDTKDIQVLCFLLQPLVENAIKHGMKSNENGVQIRILTEQIDHQLKIEIINTGKYIPEESSMGTGLNNVSQRLANAYPDDHTFEIKQVSNSVHVMIKIRLDK